MLAFIATVDAYLVSELSNKMGQDAVNETILRFKVSNVVKNHALLYITDARDPGYCS